MPYEVGEGTTVVRKYECAFTAVPYRDPNPLSPTMLQGNHSCKRALRQKLEMAQRGLNPFKSVLWQHLNKV